MRRGLRSGRIAVLAFWVALVAVFVMGAAPGRAMEMICPPVATICPPVGTPWSPHEEYIFGRRFEAGDGVPQNYLYATYWYRQAADAGDPRAQLALARDYVAGIGVVQNLALGYAWANLAAARLPHGSDEWERAVAYRRILTFRVSPAQLTEAQALSSTICCVVVADPR